MRYHSIKLSELLLLTSYFSLFTVALAVPLVASATHCPADQVELGSDPVHANILCGPAPGGASGGAGGGSAARDSSGNTILPNPLGSVTDVSQIIGNVLRALFGILGSIALLMFIYGGFVWLTSGWSAEKIKKGQDTMVWAVLGIAIIFAAYAIVNFVIDTLAKRA